MGTLLSTYATSRDNNFNLIRFIAALLVLYSHSYALTYGSGDVEPLRSIIGMSWGDIAVDIFFITSGFLITSSYISRNNLIAFIWARVLRIYPALFVAVIFCVFVVGLWFTTHNTWDYLSNPQTYKYILKNITLFFGIEFQLPGVFNDNPWKNGVNGSLWTLPYEVKMYAILAIILTCVAYAGKQIKSVTFKNALLTAGLLSLILFISNHFEPVFKEKFIKLFYMFFIGATYYAWRERIRLSSKWFFIAMPLLLVSALNKDVFFILYCLLLPYLIFYIAYVPAGKVLNFNRIGDYSYGIYIYAFPVQQAMAALIPNITVTTMIVYTFVITLILSMLSWHLIEKRFLKMKGTYILIEDFVQRIGLTRSYTRSK